MNTIEVNSFTEVPENFTGIVEHKEIKAKIWYKEGKFHREDGPAREYWSGTKHWFKEGKLHRTDGPAIVGINGYKEWCIDGKLHRLDGPAIEQSNGCKEWYLEGFFYCSMFLEILFKDSVFLEKQKGKYDLYWLKFLTEEGIQEFPIIPGMREDEEFKVLFEKLGA